MIEFQKKRFLRKNIRVAHNAWNECTQDELLFLFKVLESRWYKEDSRILVSDFLNAPEASETFPIKIIKKLAGPDDQLRGMTFGQWAFIERKMFDLSQNSCDENILLLMSCLFIKENSIFNSSIYKQNIKYFKGLPKHYYNAAVRCWDAQRRWCYSLYPYVFPKSNSDIQVQASAPEYVKIMRSFAGSPADSEVEKIFNSNVHSILSALNDELKPKKKK